ncbi:helix-turn-helix transcriptional regulator [Nocardioides lijunqiniae]|uniref:helix-turn-helix transcriptional regulator n=1 Tax=Nocardioides lijunqiniae TaxID=2760832 RepID=UPI0030B7F82A
MCRAAAAVIIVGPVGESGRSALLELLGQASSTHELVDAAIFETRHGTSELLETLSAHDLVQALSTSPRTAPTHELAAGPLSPRELDVLRLIAIGLTNQEIATRLHLSMNTIKTYIRTGYRKLGVVHRSQAVILMRDHAQHQPTPAAAAPGHAPASHTSTASAREAR